MVKVKEKIKVKTGTVVKIDVDDKGMVRVTKGSTPWVDIDEEDEEDYEEPQSCSSPVYHPTEIVYGGKKYVLKEPLQCECEFTPDGGNDTFFIDYDPFLIWGAGRTWEEAVDFFNCQFADTYEIFNEDGEDKLCNVYKDILRAMNKQVIKVETDDCR